VGRSRERVRRDVIVRVAEIIGRVEGQDREDDQENPDPEAVLRGVIRMEGQSVLRPLDVDPGRVGRPRNVKRPDVEDDHSGDHERQQIVEREEAVQRRLVWRIAAEQPLLDRLADDRDRPEQAGDHLGAPEAHLAPGQDVAHERRRHHQQKDDEAEHPHQLARRLVGAVIHAPEDVDVGDDEEQAGAVGVGVAEEPALVDVAHDVLDRLEGMVAGRRIMHGENDPGDDLDGQSQAGENPEIPPVIQVARHRIAAADRAVDEARKRQPLVEPAHQRVLGFIFLSPGEAHLMPPCRL
jgi:hypothetical protein